jgi:hypothetical protein
MAAVNRIQIKHPTDAPFMKTMNKKGNLNYWLISILFLLPAALLILGVILFLNSSPPPSSNKTKQNISVRTAELQKSVLPTEARDLKINPVVLPTAQKPDLKKQAGNLFNYVFDEGIFSKPSNARAHREFVADQKSGTVILRIDYDVSHEQSVSGLYFKTRNLDLSKMKRLSFSAKADDGKALPDRFRIELKSNASLVRRFSVAPMARDWRFYHFDFDFGEPTEISEMALVFENALVGRGAAVGTVYLKNLTIE